jgi:DNA-binding XRE family transcriptional regulator
VNTARKSAAFAAAETQLKDNFAEKWHGLKGAITMTIGKAIKEKRIERDLSQQELSDLSGVSKQMICAVENNKRIPSVTIAKKLAKTLRCSLDELFGEAS